MQFFKNKANIIITVLALAITLAIRYFVFTPDSNLLIVSVTFLLTFALLYLLRLLASKLF